MSLLPRHSYTITGYSADISPAWRQRLLSLGLLPGSCFNVLRVAPFGDPVEIRAGRACLMLRRKDLAQLLLKDSRG